MKGLKDRKVLLWWIPLGVLVSLTAVLFLADGELQDEITRALATERAHVGYARSVRETARETYVAMLERWIRPASERGDRARLVARFLDKLRGETTAFVELTPLNQTEATARTALLVALAQFQNRVQKALITEDGPAAIAEMREYSAAINSATEQVLSIDSVAGRKSDSRMQLLRRKHAVAMSGVVILGVGVLSLAFVWWLQKRKAILLCQAAEFARERQEQTALLRNQFYDHLSHELRTPIIVIQNLTLDLLEPHTFVIAKRIRQAADELLQGINNILDSSKLEAGKNEVRFESVDIEQVIRRSIHRCQGLIGVKALTVEAVVDDELPRVEGDVVKLYQVVTNLVANAVKFTDHGCVTVRAFCLDKTSMKLEVSDTGIGIPKDAMTHIWQPFEQADETISSRFGGTGLGLSLVKTLVELHHGQVGATSKTGEGSCFWVTLPIAQAVS